VSTLYSCPINLNLPSPIIPLYPLPPLFSSLLMLCSIFPSPLLFPQPTPLSLSPCPYQSFPLILQVFHFITLLPLFPKHLTTLHPLLPFPYPRALSSASLLPLFPYLSLLFTQPLTPGFFPLLATLSNPPWAPCCPFPPSI